MAPLAREKIRITSWWRSPTVNQNVGGVAASQHLWGVAVDFPLSSWGVASQLERNPYLEVIRESDHYHVELSDLVWPLVKSQISYHDLG